MPIDFKLVALIEAMNDKPIAFNRHYVSLGCGINGALMLSQMVYWSKRTKDQNGYFYKTQDEWVEETGLTRYEQEGARKKLKELGFISEHKHGVPCKVHFKVNHERLYSALIQYVENQQTGMWENHKLDSGKPANKAAEKQQTNTENTAEINSEITTDINNVFSFWKTVFSKTDRTKLEGKRLSSIKGRLKDGYSVDEIKTAIVNVSKSQWHIDNGQTDIELICRNQINLDKYLALKPSQNTQYQTTAQRTAQEHDKWRMAEQQVFDGRDVTPQNNFLIGDMIDV